MRPYTLIDLHCDTLTDCMYSNSSETDTLDDPARAVADERSEERLLGADFRERTFAECNEKI